MECERNRRLELIIHFGLSHWSFINWGREGSGESEFWWECGELSLGKVNLRWRLVSFLKMFAEQMNGMSARFPRYRLLLHREPFLSCLHLSVSLWRSFLAWTWNEVNPGVKLSHVQTWKFFFFWIMSPTPASFCCLWDLRFPNVVRVRWA